MKSNTRKLLKPIFEAVDQALSNNFNIQIDEKIHQEYINYHDQIDIDKYDYEMVIKKSKGLLLDPKVAEEIKKKLLFLLGHFATKECFDILRQYLDSAQTNLKEWATLALKELQFKVENVVYEDGRDMIMSPMGRKGDKIRYFVVIGSKHNKFLVKNAKKIIEQDLITIVTKTNSQIEEIEFGRNYIFFTILMSFNISVGKIIDDFLDIISKKKKILKYHYLVVNTHKITKKEIDEYLKMEEVMKL
ncbi:hypothetical protein A2966_01290 [Candidatus Roizmanbacteria bacterium RIFCSPLOWO2_01_FULL_41_22]|uniref:Uncharacterized protein n=1 Tax=Candidatus Roizmanbacteria bacterium RIFCSPLOWO2_01_FULL_41_22 TaxID=1802067 RepID=A0A1F7J807_9BACT|nr:MAG: hypothetical protein A2966_01290 [Candidatus Roizmanbacteria bacterium RIFCSPLOWO2_01_FULL_41_22]